MTIRISSCLAAKLMGQTTTMITNGTFDSVTTGWTASTATLTSEASGQSGNHLRVAESGGASPGKAYQDITTSIGKWYRLSLYFKKGTADYGKFMVGTTGSEAAIYDSGNLNDAAWAQKEVTFKATDTTTRITLESVDATAGEYSGFDEVKCHVIEDGLREIMRKGKAVVYSGSQPDDPDDASSGYTALITITVSSGAWTAGSETNGLDFGTSTDGVLAKDATQVWSGVAGATGTAGWMRIFANEADSGADDSSAKAYARIDMACGVSTGEARLSSTSISSGATYTVDSCSLTMPRGV